VTFGTLSLLLRGRQCQLPAVQAERALEKQSQRKELLAMGLDPDKVNPKPNLTCDVLLCISYITHVSGTPATDER
jgi:hypothetical protein